MIIRRIFKIIPVPIIECSRAVPDIYGANCYGLFVAVRDIKAQEPLIEHELEHCRQFWKYLWVGYFFGYRFSYKFRYRREIEGYARQIQFVLSGLEGASEETREWILEGNMTWSFNRIKNDYKLNGRIEDSKIVEDLEKEVKRRTDAYKTKNI